MSVSRVHHCVSQEMVAQGLAEPPAKRCTCRKFVPYQIANQMVKNGEAIWVVVKRERGTHEVTCKLCGGDPEVKKCAQCGGSGKVVESIEWDTYDGHDVVRVSQASIDKKEKKYRPALALKTPRVATIERNHIIRAYVENNKEAEARIEEYGSLIQWQLQERGARLRNGEEILFDGNPEPKNIQKSYPPGTYTFADGSKNKSWWWVIEGRDNDHGRTI